MKRSEIVAKCADVLLQFMPSVSQNKRNLITDVMLTEFERNGMLPPLTKLSHLDGYDNGWDAECEIPEYAMKCANCKCEEE